MALAKTPRASPPPLPTWYGTTPAKGTVDAEAWLGHNATEGWSDAGASEQVVGQYTDAFAGGVDRLVDGLKTGLTADMEATIAGQVKDAIAEYAAAIEFEVAIVDGELVIAAVLGNDAARIKAYVPLAEVMTRAVEGAATDAAFQQGLQMVGHQLMSAVTRAPAPAPRLGQPHRRVAAQQGQQTQQRPTQSADIGYDAAGAFAVPARNA